MAQKTKPRFWRGLGFVDGNLGGAGGVPVTSPGKSYSLASSTQESHCRRALGRGLHLSTFRLCSILNLAPVRPHCCLGTFPSSVDLQPERFDDRRPESNIGCEGPPEFFGV